MDFSNDSQGFTLVELIVVITILAILATIGFVSLLGFQQKSRDSVRLADMNTIIRAIELSKLETGDFPSVSSGSLVTFTGATIWTQGNFGQESVIDARRISEVPQDPLTGNPYPYSTTQSTSEYQVGVLLEGNIFSQNIADQILPQAYAADIEDFGGMRVGGNYNGTFIVHSEEISDQNKRLYLLGVPSILTSEITDVSIQDIFTNNSFVYSGKKAIPGPYLSRLTGSVSDWSFIPTITQDGIDNSEDALVFVTTSQDMSTGTGKLNLVSNLKNYYENTDISTKDGINKKIEDINLSDEVETIKLAEAIIYSEVGGFNEVKIDTRGVANSTPIDEEITETGIPTGSEIFSQNSQFTKYWDSNSCDPSGINVIDVLPGTNTLPSSLAENTVYNLSDGDYIVSSSITFAGNCTAVIGTGNSNIYSNTKVTAILFVIAESNIILHGLNIDGTSDGNGGIHSQNSFGIVFYNGSYYNTASNIKTFNNGTGFSFHTNATHNYVKNLYSYNNSGQGIHLNGGEINNNFNNILSFNNGGRNFYGSTSHNTALNNIVLFNNDSLGAEMQDSDNVFINNIVSYKGSAGMWLIVDSDNTTTNDVYIYENNGGTMYAPSNGKYYGNLTLFGGSTSIPSNMLVGNDGFNVNLNLSGGQTFLDTETFSSNWAISPNVSGWDSTLIGKQCQSGAGCGNEVLTGEFNQDVVFSYGSNIPNQKRPIRYNTSTSQYEYYGVDGVDYDSSKKIGQW